MSIVFVRPGPQLRVEFYCKCLAPGQKCPGPHILELYFGKPELTEYLKGSGTCFAKGRKNVPDPSRRFVTYGLLLTGRDFSRFRLSLEHHLGEVSLFKGPFNHLRHCETQPRRHAAALIYFVQGFFDLCYSRYPAYPTVDYLSKKILQRGKGRCCGYVRRTT